MGATPPGRGGGEVACRTYGGILDAWEGAGRTWEELTAGSGVTVDELRDRGARIGWASHCRILANTRSEWDERALVDLGRHAIASPLARPFTLPARLQYSPADFYDLMTHPERGIAHRMFSCISFRTTAPEKGRLVIEATMADGYEPSREHFLITMGSLISMPTLLGLSDARVHMEEVEGGVRYVVRPPPGGRMLARLRRVVTWPFTAREAARELERAFTELHDSNTRLLAEIAERGRVEGERADLIRDLEAKNEELASRNEELQRFTYAVSHDLKSPLVTIRGFVGLLAKDVAARDAERVASDIARIVEATDAMGRLLDELLELSRVGRLVSPPEEVDLGDLAEEAVRLATGEITEGGVEVRVASGMPTVLGERRRLMEVFQNLIGNAVKFRGDRRAPLVEIGGAVVGGDAVCWIRDNGIGIDERHHRRIFELFHRLDDSVEGVGVGLALVRRIVEVHGGEIGVDSDGPGTGSTFRFRLPVRGANALAWLARADEEAEAAPGGQRADTSTDGP